MTTWLAIGQIVQGSQMKLKNSDDPERWWTLLEVGNQVMEEESVRAQERNYRDFQGSTRGDGID